MDSTENPGLWPEDFLESCFAATQGDSTTSSNRSSQNRLRRSKGGVMLSEYMIEEEVK